MIPLLRAGALGVNVAVAVGTPLLLGLAWPWAVACCIAFFALVAWACRRAPDGEDAGEQIRTAGLRAAERMGAPPPRYVRLLPGWTAGAIRSGTGYGLVVGREVAPHHHEAVFAHEIAHVVCGDLAWEPWTDGPARLLLPAVRKVPPLGVAVFPFFLFASPLARRTELEADRRAASAIPTYPAVLKEVAQKMGNGGSILYPPFRERIQSSARDSLVKTREE